MSKKQKETHPQSASLRRIHPGVPPAVLTNARNNQHRQESLDSQPTLHLTGTATATAPKISFLSHQPLLLRLILDNSRAPHTWHRFQDVPGWEVAMELHAFVGAELLDHFSDVVRGAAQAALAVFGVASAHGQCLRCGLSAFVCGRRWSFASSWGVCGSGKFVVVDFLHD